MLSNDDTDKKKLTLCLFILEFSSLKNCRKIGEGVFGEVFLNQAAKSSYVLKIIPIEGTLEINQAQQKRFDEILQEVIITQELSDLRYDSENRTAGFVEVLNVRLVKGRYPSYLLALWNAYKEHHEVHNDSPEIFDENQLYVVFELANCGLDLEAYTFKNADQSYSAFKQVTYTKLLNTKHKYLYHQFILCCCLLFTHANSTHFVSMNVAR